MSSSVLGASTRAWLTSAHCDLADFVALVSQQTQKADGKPNWCLADFVAPRAAGVDDYVGAFAVTAGVGIEKKLAEFAAHRERAQAYRSVSGRA